MSEYQQFLQERDQIDFLIQKGYRIGNVKETLSGAFVEFVKTDSKTSEETTETLKVVTPEGRKYFSVLIIKQQKAGA